MTTAHDRTTAEVDHTIGAHGRLAINLASAELRLAGSDGGRVVVRNLRGSLKDRVVVETTDDGLTIREPDARGLSFRSGRHVVQLEIEVPAAAEITVDTASGWIDAQGLTGRQRYRTASGDIRLQAVAGRIELNTASGDTTIDLAGSTELVVKTVSGDLAVVGGSLAGLQIATMSGDIRIDSPMTATTGNAVETLSGDVALLAANGIRVDARTVSGDLSTTLPHESEGRMGRRTLIVGDGSIELAFRSVSGDLLIHDGSGRGAQSARSRSSRTFQPEMPEMPEMPEIPEMPEMPEMPDLRALLDLRRLPGIPDLTGLPFSRRNAAEPNPASADADAADPADSADPVDLDDPAEAGRMAILRALESGELDVATAMDRLAALDQASTGEQERADG